MSAVPPAPFDPDRCSPVAHALLGDPRIAHRIDEENGSLILALQDELLVPAGGGSQVSHIAAHRGFLNRDRTSDSGPVEVWQITPDNLDHDRDSFFWATEGRPFPPPDQDGLRRASVTPNHIGVVSHYDTCPYGPPSPVDDPGTGWIPPFEQSDPPVGVAVIDTGLVDGNDQLYSRGGVNAVPGYWFDSPSLAWRECRVDEVDSDRDCRLDALAGHGTFSAGLVARMSAGAELTVVGHRHEAFDVRPSAPDGRRLFATEFAIALSLWEYSHLAEVVLCQFAFPTYGGCVPLTLEAALADAPERTAIVAPVGNESLALEHWPAAFDRVIGVAATDAADTEPASDFTNWGSWANCCARGEDVLSSFLHWQGQREWPPETQPALGAQATAPVTFSGWATWSGTCFAAAQVAGKIADEAARTGNDPATVAADLIAGLDKVSKDGVELPHFVF